MGDDNLERLIIGNVEMANKHADIMNALQPGEVKRWLKTLFDTHHVVWGVWNDPEKGVGMFPLKGDAILRASSDVSPPVALKITAILCTPEEGKKAMLEARPNENQAPLR